MQAKVLPGYEGGLTVGQRKVAGFTATGPTSYNTSTKDAFLFTALSYIDFVQDSVSVSKNYVVAFVPSVAGPRASWAAIWIAVATGLEVTSGTNLSAESIIGQAWGGDF